MKVSEFQEKFDVQARLQNDLNLPKYINNYNAAIARNSKMISSVYNEDITNAATDVCKAAYIEFITCAFEISLDIVTTALIDIGLLTTDKVGRASG